MQKSKLSSIFFYFILNFYISTWDWFNQTLSIYHPHLQSYQVFPIFDRTVNCDVNRRITATWCHYIKKLQTNIDIIGPTITFWTEICRTEKISAGPFSTCISTWFKTGFILLKTQFKLVYFISYLFYFQYLY